MKRPRVRPVLAAAIVFALPATASAQFPSPPAPPSGAPPAVQNRWPDPPKPPPAEPLKPQAQPERKPADAGPAASAAKPKAQKPQPKPRAPSNVVACSGVFAKGSSHLKLAVKYDSRNIVFGQVDGPDGSKLNASILYPNDPRRRLEVLWNNEAARTDLSVIAINGKSQWIAPRGLKLGLGLAAVDRINGRPFKLTGFDKDGSASVVAWQSGRLATLPGGCKIGVRLFLDRKAADTVRGAVTGDKEFLSNDAGVRAAQPMVGEILIGY